MTCPGDGLAFTQINRSSDRRVAKKGKSLALYGPFVSSVVSCSWAAGQNLKMRQADVL